MTKEQKIKKLKFLFPTHPQSLVVICRYYLLLEINITILTLLDPLYLLHTENGRVLGPNSNNIRGPSIQKEQYSNIKRASDMKVDSWFFWIYLIKFTSLYLNFS